MVKTWIYLKFTMDCIHNALVSECKNSTVRTSWTFVTVEFKYAKLSFICNEKL